MKIFERLIGLVAFASVTLSVTASAATLKSVKVGVSEALAVLDSSSSQVYRKSLESALTYATAQYEVSASKCGYKFEIETSYFDNSDKLASRTSALQLEQSGSWIIFGPRRSDQFFHASQVLSSTPFVSPMAGSQAVTSLQPPYFTMYPSVDVLAKIAIKAVLDKKIGNRFASFVDGTCAACKDFQESFRRQAEGRLVEMFSFDGAGDSPDLVQLSGALARSKVDFLLLPNYSKFSGYTISKLQAQYPNLKVVGSDGWGDGQFGFLESFGILPSVAGISVRGGAPAETMASLYGVRLQDLEIHGQRSSPHFVAYATVDFFRGLTRDLCAARPRNKAEFLAFLSKQKPTHFRSRYGVGVYELRNSQLTFSHSEKL